MDAAHTEATFRAGRYQGQPTGYRAFIPAPLPKTPATLVFVGSPGTPWHGLERAAEIATLVPGLTIDVVGMSATEWNDPETAPAALRIVPC